LRETETVNAAGSHDPPLRKTLDLVDREKYYFDLKLGAPDGAPGGAYETVDSLTRDGGRALARLMGLAQTRWKLSNRDAALAVVGEYAWGVGGPAIACYVLSRRVPDISPENVALRHDADEGLWEAALLRGRFAALPQDPAAGHPDAVVLDGESALLDWMRERLVAGIEPLLDAVRRHARVGKRGAWARVSDYAADAFLMAGWDTEDQARCAADAEAFVASPNSPLRGKTGFFVVEHRGRRGAFITRGVCCQGYKDPEHGNCDSCPMLTQEEREKRAIQSLAAG
jgi:hypothetical protein